MKRGHQLLQSCRCLFPFVCDVLYFINLALVVDAVYRLFWLLEFQERYQEYCMLHMLSHERCQLNRQCSRPAHVIGSCYIYVGVRYV